MLCVQSVHYVLYTLCICAQCICQQSECPAILEMQAMIIASGQDKTETNFPSKKDYTCKCSSQVKVFLF